MKKIVILLVINMLLFSVEAFSASKDIAKVLKLRGNIVYKIPSKGVKGKLTKDMGLPEGSIIVSGAKSYVKLIFLDKSRLTIGPKSKVEIKKFSRNEAGVVNLLKGKIRSQVTKNYLEIQNKNKSKLFITTKNAAMGVRGTDFQVKYDNLANTTDLITFSGVVAFNHFKGGADVKINQDSLEQILNRPEAVNVTKSKFVRAEGEETSTLEVKTLPAIQARKLKKDDTLESTSDESAKIRDVVPPGVTSDVVAGNRPATTDVTVSVSPPEVSIPDSSNQAPILRRKLELKKLPPPPPEVPIVKLPEAPSVVKPVIETVEPRPDDSQVDTTSDSGTNNDP